MKRHVELRRSSLSRSTKPIPKVNAKRKAKRRKKYAAHLRSPYFRALRMERFTLDGFRCRRCGGIDETRTGKGLEAAHRTYARFGHENIDDIETACTRCHRYEHAMQGKRINPEPIGPIVGRVMNALIRPRPTKGVA
jgi:5-methylcytosine-specific restriction endonuclease McrA